ncbi:MAG TPA: alanine/ornithine racemase family PLP-dependent enzyme [Coriobacteriia bacterium]
MSTSPPERAGKGRSTLARATVTVDLGKIAENTRLVCAALGQRQVVGVTKVTCGSPEVARAMVAGGAAAIGDSRLENLARLREAGIDVPLWLLRSPTPTLADDTVRLADVSLESEAATIRALDAAAARLGCRHRVVVMVDLGDLREGVIPAELPRLLDGAASLKHVDIVGIGVSLTCFGAVVPTAANLGELVGLAEDAERRLGRRMLVSGGMSSSLDLLATGELPARVDALRVGESILLGVSTVTREPILGLSTDAITLRAPVIECARKPSAPRGIVAQDAFGGRPVFEDHGERLRAICALGRQDVSPEGLRPLESGVAVLGASSDHLILDVENRAEPTAVGDAIAFVPDYAATLRLFTSPYVAKEYVAKECVRA